MAVAIPTPADMPGADAPAIDASPADTVDAALARLRPVTDRRLAAVLQAAPWALTLYAIYLLGVVGPLSARDGAAPLNLPPHVTKEGGGMMIATGVAAAAAGLFAGQLLLACIPETFPTLWRRKVIAIPR